MIKARGFLPTLIMWTLNEKCVVGSRCHFLRNGAILHSSWCPAFLVPDDYMDICIFKRPISSNLKTETEALTETDLFLTDFLFQLKGLDQTPIE
ncbi:hypothetical protein CEXT_355991 [Caerostris extrusa]|uniref:Uncharacterized protein n=1 Tax=Caerostris extrusa TaxID=172846 RepID=A0AAV4R134_CAEEX|nr:hypothetical protein CEXT_355991 [Caerostris extrusa]